MEIPVLTEVVTIFGLSILVILVCNFLKIPSIVGFLITGVISGPHGLGLVSDLHQVEMLAEIGVILLLFTIGIEFSFKNLMLIRNSVLIGGSVMVLLTILLACLGGILAGKPVNQSVFIGFLLALSSSAIVLKLLQEGSNVESPHGRTTLAILIFQDIIVVPFMLLVPILSGDGGSNMWMQLGVLLFKAVVVITAVIYGSTKLMPRLLYHVAKTRSNELFLLTTIVVCFAVAGLTSMAGLSLALGAFLAGLIISESEYSHQALGNIMPFRDVFTSFFFVSIGMLFNLSFLWEHIGEIFIVTILVIGVKTAVGGFAANVLGFPMRTAIITGLFISQVGEFSFVLAKVGLDNGLIQEYFYQFFLAVSILTMLSTPFIMRIAPAIAEQLSKLPLPARIVKGLPGVYKAVQKKEQKILNDHLVIIGYGVNGQNVAKAARAANIPYAIIEMSTEGYSKAKKSGEPAFYGDAMHQNILKHASIHKARVVVIALSDPAATKRVISNIRSLTMGTCVIVRNKYMKEADELVRLGADEVISEEFETSIEIFTRVLNKYLVPHDEIETFVKEIRTDNYEMFRGNHTPQRSVNDLHVHLSDMEISTIRIKDGSWLNERTLADLNLRKKFGVSVLAVERNKQTYHNPGGEFEVKSQDLLILFGKAEGNNACMQELSS